jgi:hypothetical protein
MLGTGDTMTEPLQPEILDTLVCEPASRPKDAPTIGDILPAVRAALRDERHLTVMFDRTATDLVSAVVEAERRCCPTIVWDLETACGPALRIGATPGQLDVLEAIFSPARATP